MITAGGLVFIAATFDGLIRAFDIKTGRILWSGELPAAGIAGPMSYAVKGRQFIVVAAGGHSDVGQLGDSLVAFALPQDAIRGAQE